MLVAMEYTGLVVDQFADGIEVRQSVGAERGSMFGVIADDETSDWVLGYWPDGEEWVELARFRMQGA